MLFAVLCLDRAGSAANRKTHFAHPFLKRIDNRN